FRREAHSAASLNHPNIVAIYDSGEDSVVENGGTEAKVPYIVMEYVAGQTLREKLDAAHVLAPDEAARITQRILDALAYSHRRGIVHRDIKPANVMISITGEVKVMDFGIARAIADTAATMTQTHSVIGTAQYLSPEQGLGSAVDSRSDLYSTGCLLYELLTGRPPFRGDSPVAMVFQHVNEAPQPPSTFAPRVSPGYDAIVLHALEKDRDSRYRSAEEFRADLANARSGMPVSAAALGSANEDPASATMVLPSRASRHDPVPAPMTFPAQESAEQPPGRGRGVFVLLLLAALLAVAAGGLGLKYLLGGSTDTTQVKVPYVIGMSQADAERLLTSRGLVPKVVAVSGTTFAPGLVADQRPKKDESVASGGRVEIDVSSGPESVAVPDVEGLTEAEARTLLETNGLRVTQIVLVNDNAQKKGRVIEADPAIGQIVKTGDAITLRIASGKVPVPDLTRKDVTVVLQLLAAKDLELATPEYVITSETADGLVLEQTPAPDALVDVGSTVKVKVAKAPP
ncbi:MAG TPA: Stk1 family PASTA domain-containing Ser/Thr kinase, partial [Candidatus Lustribacter sp.]|nr:Stk1 family PASTA domain-containing Ser/Thr kinase [Candidatus Lustribacter sp.]